MRHHQPALRILPIDIRGQHSRRRTRPGRDVPKVHSFVDVMCLEKNGRLQ